MGVSFNIRKKGRKLVGKEEQKPLGGSMEKSPERPEV